MAQYHFQTIWRIPAPLDQVWQAILETEKWPSWWKGVQSVEVLSIGDEGGIGSRRRYVWRSKLPYTLAFDMEVTRIEPMSLIEGRASGELEGTGVWRLQDTGAHIRVQYDWDVSTTRWWMNLLAPLARPAFAWNHDYVMNHGREGLLRLLGSERLPLPEIGEGAGE
jgi:uncharacterized protein YndB with AHSA1/START domain